MRGRVMSIYGLLLLGSAPLGALLIGWMSEQWGPRSTLLLAGVASRIAGGVAFLVRPGRKRAPEVEPEVEPESAPARVAATSGGSNPGTAPAAVAAAGTDEAA